MAIVKDYYNGNTHVIIHDDAYADLTPEQLAERQERIRRNISNIVYSALERQAAKANKES